MSAVLKVVLTKLLSEKVLKAIIIKICEYLASIFPSGPGINKSTI